MDIPEYYILVKDHGDEIDMISLTSVEQTKSDFSDQKLLKEFNNYLQFYDDETGIKMNIYVYDPINLCYALFLHKYDIKTVSKILETLEEKGYKPTCDKLLSKDGEEIKINDFKDMFKLSGGSYHDYDDDIALEGGNLFNSVAELFKKGINRVVSLVTNPIRVDAPPYYRDFLSTYGNLAIQQIIICKTPIQETFNTILNTISFGQWDKKKEELKYDNMFHLFAICKLVSGQYVRLEKNEVLSINMVDPSSYKSAKSIEIGYYTQVRPFNLNEFHQRALDAVGKERLYLYRGNSTNCQMFIYDLLNNSGLINSDIQEFVMQKAGDLIGSLPTIAQKLIQGVTDVGGFFNHVLYGAGLINKKYKMIHNKYGGSLMYVN